MGCNSSKKKLNGENADGAKDTENAIKKNNNINVQGGENNENLNGYQNFKDSVEDDWLSQLKQEVNQSYIDEKK